MNTCNIRIGTGALQARCRPNSEFKNSVSPGAVCSQEVAVEQNYLAMIFCKVLILSGF